VTAARVAADLFACDCSVRGRRACPDQVILFVREAKGVGEGVEGVGLMGGDRRWAFAVRHRGLAADLWHDLAGDQLNLAALVTYWPEVDSLAACARIARQQLRALVHRADADPAAKLRRVFFDQGTDNLGQDPFRV
jgi:hypothetical protein